MTFRAIVLASFLAWGTPLVTSAQSTEDGASSTEVSEAAKKLLRSGMVHFQAQEYEEALKRLQEAFDISQSPNVQLVIARTLEKLERPVEAAHAYLETERLAGENARYDLARLHAKQERATLGERVAYLLLDTSKAPPGHKVYVNDSLTDSQLVAVHPGVVHVTATAAGHRPFSSELDVGGGSKVAMQIQLEESHHDREANVMAPPNDSGDAGPWTELGLVGLGLGVAGAAVFGIFYGLAENQHETISNECAAGCTDARRAELKSTGLSYQLWTNVGLVTAVSGLSVGSLLLAIGAADGGSESEALTLVPSPGGLGVRAKF